MRDDASDLHARAFSVGVAVAIAFLLPLLGRDFAEATGIHPRLISYAALAFVSVQSSLTRGASQHRTAYQLDVIALGLLVCVLALFPWSGPVWVLDDPLTVRDYPGYKLTRMLTLAVPTALVGLAARRFVRSARFVDGMTWGATAIAGLALLSLVANRGAIQGSDLGEMAERVGFSTISLSLVFVVLQVVWCHRYLEERRHAWRPIVATVVGLLGVFLLTQRTALLLIILFGLYVAFRDAQGRARTMAIVGGSVFALWILLDVAAVDMDTSGLLAQFPAQVRRIEALVTAQDSSSSIRVVMWKFGWSEGWSAPEGHGVGAFASQFPANRYPHNVFIEALYELGVPGAIFAGALLVLTTSTIVALLRARNATMVAFVLITTFSYVLKAGDLSVTGNWLLWLYLGRGVLEGRSS